MYNKNYFPTPEEVISLMVRPHIGQIKQVNILEPSAGMGAILDFLVRKGANKTRLYACEYDQQLKASLIGKGYKVIQDDFLQYSGALDFGLILMNPPFDRGDEHLLKAWDIMRNGHVVCLLNEETINNPYTESRRRLISVIWKNGGTVEYLGKVFGTAARSTGVKVALVRLEKKSEQSKVLFDMKGAVKVDEIDISSDSNAMERADHISALTRSYRKAIESTEAMYKAMTDFNLYVGAFCTEYDTPKLISAFFNTSRKSGYSDAHNEFALAFQKHAWNAIFTRTKASGLMTNKVREKFDKWREDMGGIDLNEENIMMLFDGLIQQRKTIADECIVDAFDKITSYAERRSPGGKWKTNSFYMVPEKFILPWIVENSKYGGGLSIYHRAHDFLDDIDRAFCLISGKRFPVYNSSTEDKQAEIRTTIEAIRAWCRDKDQPEESEFFEFKCHLKGTVHFKVKDTALLAEFNRRACEKKGFVLPEEELYRGKSRRGQKVS